MGINQTEVKIMSREPSKEQILALIPSQEKIDKADIIESVMTLYYFSNSCEDFNATRTNGEHLKRQLGRLSIAEIRDILIERNLISGDETEPLQDVLRFKLAKLIQNVEDDIDD